MTTVEGSAPSDELGQALSQQASADWTEEMVSRIADGDSIFIGTGAGEPDALVRALVEEVLSRRRDLKIIQVTNGGSEQIVQPRDQTRGHVLLLPATGPAGARAITEARAQILSLPMSGLARAIEVGELPVDVALLAVAPAGDGSYTPGLSMDVAGIAAAKARFRALQVSPGLPVIPHEPWLEPRVDDLIVESEMAIGESVSHVVTPAQLSIGRHVGGLLPPNSVVEIGIGRGLNGLADGLIAEGCAGLSVHTGLISENVQRLVESEVVDRANGCHSGALVVGTVVEGRRSVMEWADGNDRVRLVASHEAHHVGHLASIDGFTAINAAGEVDLTGQVGTRLRAAQFGGGGLLDFASAGANAGGSIITLESRDGNGRSRIRARVDTPALSGALVTHVVTEHGTATLRGKSALERAEAIIAIAHPDDRDGLASAHEAQVRITTGGAR